MPPSFLPRLLCWKFCLYQALLRGQRAGLLLLMIPAKPAHAQHLRHLPVGVRSADWWVLLPKPHLEKRLWVSNSFIENRRAKLWLEVALLSLSPDSMEHLSCIQGPSRVHLG